MQQLFSRYKIQIDQTTLRLLAHAKNEFRHHPWCEDVFERLSEVATKGKSVRGGLMLATCEMYKHPLPTTWIQIAAALELAHLSLLIFDDIQDQDQLRRGLPAMHTQYRTLATNRHVHNPEHTGDALAICVGIISYFLPLQILANNQLEPTDQQALLRTFATDMLTVGFGQMHDIYTAAAQHPLSLEETLYIHTNKTAIYTFSLPFTIGCILTKQPQSTIAAMRSLGETLGIVFQIKDDMLGVFGNSEQTGKPVGADIMEKKQTLYQHYLNALANTEELTQLEHHITHNDQASALTTFRSLVRHYAIDHKITNLLDQYHAQSLTQITALPIDENAREQLRALVTFIINRST